MIEAIILGIVQGLTELLPISSSGHLAILENFFGIKEPMVFTVFLHFGTFIATVVFFIKPIINIIIGLSKGERESIKYFINIILGTVPVVIFALIFKSMVRESFYNIKLIVIFFGLTGIILLLTGFFQNGKKRVGPLQAFITGIGQMFAIFPGLSRSGLTISTGLFAGVKPEESFQFSFLLSLPAVFGAHILELKHIHRIDNIPNLIIGVIMSFSFGLLSLRILKNLVNCKFHLFGLYCLVISLIMLILIQLDII